MVRARSTPFACLCPAPFFDTEVALEPGDAVALRYAVVIADGEAEGAPGGPAGRGRARGW